MLGYIKLDSKIFCQIQTLDIELTDEENQYAQHRCREFLILDIYNINTRKKMLTHGMYTVNDIIKSNTIFFICEDAAYWYNFLIPDNYTGKYYKYNMQGVKIIELEYKKGERNGMKCSWYGNGQRKSRKCYRDGKYRGHQMRWSTDGTLVYDKYFP